MCRSIITSDSYWTSNDNFWLRQYKLRNWFWFWSSNWLWFWSSNWLWFWSSNWFRLRSSNWLWFWSSNWLWFWSSNWLWFWSSNWFRLRSNYDSWFRRDWSVTIINIWILWSAPSLWSVVLCIFSNFVDFDWLSWASCWSDSWLFYLWFLNSDFKFLDWLRE